MGEYRPPIIEKGSVALFVDIENLFIAAREDKSIDGAEKSARILKTLPPCLLRIASTLGPIAHAYGALSLPRSTGQNGGSDRSARTEEVIAMQLAFVNAGMPTILVPAGHNAADEALMQQALRLMRNSFIKTFVIATGDGREPFPELLRILTEKNKTVHVVAYDKLPHIIQNRVYPCTYDRIASIMRETLPESAISKESVFSMLEMQKPQNSYKLAMTAFKKGSSIGAEPYDQHIRLAANIFKKEHEKRRMRALPIGSIAHMLKDKFFQKRVVITIEDALDITYAFTKLSGLFKSEERYSINPAHCELFELV